MDSKKLLSKNLLMMKFMQRTKEKVEQIEEEQKTAHLLDKDVQKNTIFSKRDQVIVEPSFVICENLVFGRMSFKGYNPDIERLMEEKSLDHNPLKRKAPQDEVELTPKEMADSYDKMSVDPGQHKFQGRNQGSNQGRNKKRARYVRPVDDN